MSMARARCASRGARVERGGERDEDETTARAGTMAGWVGDSAGTRASQSSVALCTAVSRGEWSDGDPLFLVSHHHASAELSCWDVCCDCVPWEP